MNIKLEQKLKSSLISNALEQEVLEKLDWYRNQLMVTTRELNTLKNKVWTETPYAKTTINLYWKYHERISSRSLGTAKSYSP